ncbi:UDP-glycosyltransferase 88A1-like [Nymphaea colorata]|uniref:Glycosyltransferase n=2 Tax=Nymphaea colorata TaxID=210225 RepID=A0A5K1AMY0_9MAGN|nr:UDP-glycosyltransferase 88A1-like [Nymphaea colorata]XP_031475708.1 UDP-glycosyltransferase 88A1-like [Nymphaea colorata]
MKQQRRTVVLYPSPGMGHLITMVELGKLIHLRLRLPVTVLIASPPFNLGDSTPYIKAVESSNLGVSFHHLPQPLDFSNQHHNAQHHELLIFEFLNTCNPHVKDALELISQSSTILAFVVDFFCISSMSVAAGSLGLPVYIYFTSSAGVLATFLYLNELDHQTDLSFRNLNADLHIPGIPPLPSLDMPLPMLDREETYFWFLEVSSQLSRAQGLIVNTFDALEPRALQAISDGLCVPNGPPSHVHAIGPVIASWKKADGDAECLNWLDSQPDRSVVFLCFGSLGRFSMDQLREIADGLERSGQRFLWVVRSPGSGSGPALVSSDADPQALLPQGFLERTRDRGLVVKSWAPQTRVLSHGAVGGFMTHCGWNSVLECVCAGVPMVAWPLYAEQRINRALLVKELCLAVAIQEGPDGLVGAAEVERCVRLLMGSEEGARLRERAEAARDAAAAAVKEGGSSWASLARLGDEWESRVATDNVCA